jgi:hypothetical protein
MSIVGIDGQGVCLHFVHHTSWQSLQQNRSLFGPTTVTNVSLSFPEAQCSGPPPPRLLDGLEFFAQYQLYCVGVILG